MANLVYFQYQEGIEVQVRANWGSRLGFLFAAIGSAIGLGNLWKFPYMAYRNGGGAFLIPYIFALLTIGVPLLIFEMALGQKTGKATPLAFGSVSKKWEWLGWWPVILTSFGVGFYYMVVLSWCLNYFLYSFKLSWGAETDSFFHKVFLGLTSGAWNIGGIKWPIFIGAAFFWVFVWFIVVRGIKDGIEKANKVLMPALFIMTVLFVVWSVTLPNASAGLKLYFTPDFTKLKDPHVWIDALKQVFFSVGVGFGIMVTYASYLPKDSDTTTNALITALADGFYSMFASIAIFATIGYMAGTLGKDPATVIKGGPGLAFVVYPQAINLIPKGKVLFGAVFFFLLLAAGITSAISLFENFVSAFVDKFGVSRKFAASILMLAGIVGSLIFSTGAGLYWLDIVDNYMMMAVMFVVYLEVMFLLAEVGLDKIKDFVDQNAKFVKVGTFWKIMMFVVPGFVGYLIVNDILKNLIHGYGGYPTSALAVGITVTLMTLVFALILWMPSGATKRAARRGSKN